MSTLNEDQETPNGAATPALIVVMGVSGTGKSTLGSALAERLNLPFIDGDDLHPKSNIEKMSSGQPLTDADREPWLRHIRETVIERSKSVDGSRGLVVACSALKRYYRDILRGVEATDTTAQPHLHPSRSPTYFVFIQGSREVLFDRMTKRPGHFMKAGMLDSQLQTLEDPTGEERVVVVSLEDSTEKQVNVAAEELGKLGV